MNTHDSSQEITTLTYKIVMLRIVKRFLLHYQKDSENSLTREFEELKQDIQMIRYEMLNDLKKSRDENANTTFLLHSGISMLGNEVLANATSEENLNLFSHFRKIGHEMKENIVEDDPYSLFVQSKSLSAINSYYDFLISQRTVRESPNEMEYEKKSLAETSSAPLPIATDDSSPTSPPPTEQAQSSEEPVDAVDDESVETEPAKEEEKKPFDEASIISDHKQASVAGGDADNLEEYGYKTLEHIESDESNSGSNNNNNFNLTNINNTDSINEYPLLDINEY